MKFILWDPKDGSPRRDDDGTFISEGVVGRITPGNVYLTVYGKRPKGSVDYKDLEVGQRVANVEFSLSGSKGTCDVYRVE